MISGEIPLRIGSSTPEYDFYEFTLIWQYFFRLIVRSYPGHDCLMLSIEPCSSAWFFWK